MEQSKSSLPEMYRGIRIPTKATLKKYGMKVEDYKMLVDEQDGMCPICKKTPSTGRLVIDHYHARNYSSLAPDVRRMYVRGLVCWFCNHSYLGRGITIEKAKNMVIYLVKFQETLKFMYAITTLGRPVAEVRIK